MGKQENIQCMYHLVLVTKFRKKIILPRIFSKLESSLRSISELNIIEVNHDEDHLHILLRISICRSIRSIITKIKSITTKNLYKSENTYLSKYYWNKPQLWNGGYHISTVGSNKQVITNYIINQGS